MNCKFVSVVMFIIFLSLSVSCILPYPNIFSTSIFSAVDDSISNDKYEDEIFGDLDDDLSIYDSIEVNNFNWFSYMNTHFTKYKTVRVIDVYSQKEYFVQRLGGYNHADVQTIDSANTKIFKSIYGGEWSWTRRPVWVEIEGEFFAGSTNGMPHGFSLIDNGEGGHTCIHFLLSKTNGTKRVDEQHQSCVEYSKKNKALLVEYLKEKDLKR